MTIGSSDSCIFCGPGECTCIKKKKPRPTKKKPTKKVQSSPPDGAATKTVERLAKPERTAARKAAARPERDQSNLIDTERSRRSEEAEMFWSAMKNLVNQGMVHPISVKRSLDSYPSIPGGG